MAITRMKRKDSTVYFAITYRYPRGRLGKQPREVTFHTLRHAFCTRFVQSGGTITDLRAVVGHPDITTTQRYAYHSQPHTARGLAGMANDLTGGDSTAAK
jgi:integrase